MSSTADESRSAVAVHPVEFLSDSVIVAVK